MKLTEEFWEKHPYLAEAKGLVPGENEPLDILLGYGLKGLTLPVELRTHPTENADAYPVAMRSSLGWTIFGPTTVSGNFDNPDQPEFNHLAIGKKNEGEEDWAVPSLERHFTDWCKGELLGVQPTRLCSCLANVIEENAFLETARQHVKRTEDGRMEVRLPWKEGFPQCLPNNRRVAVAALTSLEQTLRRKGMEKEYAEEMTRIISSYAEPVPPPPRDVR